MNNIKNAYMRTILTFECDCDVLRMRAQLRATCIPCMHIRDVFLKCVFALSNYTYKITCNVVPMLMATCSRRNQNSP